MSYSNRLLILSFFFLTPCAHAYEFFFDAFYWRPTESFDWVLINDRNTPHQNITYQTTLFHYEPGFRLGFTSTQAVADTRLSYTRFNTSLSDATSGKVTPGLLASKIAQPSGGYYFQAGQINFSIDYNVVDADLSKCFYIDDAFYLRPLIGLKASWIDQKIDTSLQGVVSVTENLKQKFKALGPKVGIEGNLSLFQGQRSQWGLFAHFSTAYLWGNWSIKDILTDSALNTVMISNNSRNQGAINFETLIGMNVNYQKISIKLGYEITDWIDQFQIFDDGTGGHSNDLVLQGMTLGISMQL